MASLSDLIGFSTPGMVGTPIFWAISLFLPKEHIKAKIEENDKVKTVWLAANKDKVLNTQFDGIIPISSNLALHIPAANLSADMSLLSKGGELSNIENWKNHILHLLLGSDYSSGPDDLTAIRKAVNICVAGEKKTVHVSAINRNNLVTAIPNISEIVKKANDEIKNLDKTATHFNAFDDEVAHNLFIACKWMISIINIVISEYVALSNEAFKVCKFIASKANTPGSFKSKEEGKKNA